MRILIMAIGSLGDILPFTALGAELQGRGHEVIFYSNDYFRRHAEEAGLRFTATSPAAEYEAFLHSPGSTDPQKAMRAVASGVMERVEASHRIMAQDVLPGRTLALASTFAFAPRLLRETHSVPCAVLHLAPSVLRSCYSAPRFSPLGHLDALPRFVKSLLWRAMDRKFMDPLYTLPFNRIRAQLGLAPIARMFHHWLHEADATLCMTPEWFAARQPDWPAALAMTGFPLADDSACRPLTADLARFLDSGPAPVVVTAGSANAVSHAFYAAAIQACTTLGLRVIAVTADPRQLPANLPETALHAHYAPFSALLPRAAAFIHHGGIGSVAQALRAGIPQVIQPMAFDQFDNASRVAQLNAGCEILPRHFQATRVAQRLQAILGNEAMAASCRRIAGALADADGVSRACDTIMEKLDPSATVLAGRQRFYERDGEARITGLRA
ncbi:MAG TPA: nucleotide disphospho-sugar-binding domain-containing protein [Telluria sp.]